MIEIMSTYARAHNRGFLRSRGLTVFSLGLIVTAVLVSPVAADVREENIKRWYAGAHGLQDLPQEAVQVAQHVTSEILPQLVGNDSAFAERLGFHSASEITDSPSSLSVEPPFAIFRVGLDRVKQFGTGIPNDFFLLNDELNWRRFPMLSPARFIFPIKAQSIVKSSVTVSLSLTGNQWDVQHLGSSKMIIALTQQGSSATHFVVWVPALLRHYLGFIEGGVFKVKVVFPDRLFNVGQVLTAKQVFTVLANVEAANMTDAPR